jgi:hypothetical protein
MLGRHPVLAAAEVRDTGRGVHALIHLDPPVVFTTTGERDKWAAAVEVVQRVLPTDPDAPGLTALTRPVGSINSKTGRAVSVLKTGTPVAPAEVLALAEDVRRTPFRTIVGIVFGPQTSPCPICRKPDTRLGVFDKSGVCYGGCGKVKVDRVFDSLYVPRAAAVGV